MLEFALSSLVIAFDKQYKSIPDDEIALLARKFRTLHKFCKKRRRSPRGCFECGDTTHFIINCPKRKKLDSSNNPSGIITAKVTIRRSTTLGTRRRRSSRR
jgi:hypothetical protein